MFTQTPRVETIRQNPRVRARGLLTVKLAFLRVRDVNIRAKCTVSLRTNAQISAYIFKLI